MLLIPCLSGCALTGGVWQWALRGGQEPFTAEPEVVLRALEEREGLRLEVLYSDRTTRRFRLPWEEEDGQRDLAVEVDREPWPLDAPAESGRPLRVAAAPGDPAEVAVDRGGRVLLHDGASFRRIAWLPDRRLGRAGESWPVAVAGLATPLTLAVDAALLPVMVPVTVVLALREALRTEPSWE